MTLPFIKFPVLICKLTSGIVLLFAITVSSSFANWDMEYEFRGYYSMDDTYSFSLYNRTTASSFWLEQGRERYGITVLDFEPGTNTLSLSFNGRDGTLKLLSDSEGFKTVDTAVVVEPAAQSGPYGEAVRISAEYLMQNPGADTLDAPIPGSVRSSLLQAQNNSNASKKDFKNSAFERSVRLQIRHQIREGRKTSSLKK